MKTDDKTIRAKLKKWAVADVPALLKDLLRTCEMVQRATPHKTVAIKSLILFKAAHILLEKRRDLAYYIEDTFEPIADRIYGWGKLSNSHLSLHPSEDCAALNPGESKALKALINALVRRKILVARRRPAAATTGVNTSVDAGLRTASIWGPLDRTWFQKDTAVNAVYRESQIPTFLPVRHKGRSR